MEKIEIPLHKGKITLMVLGSLLFIGLGYFLLTEDLGSYRYSKEVINLVGTLCILLFTLAFAMSLYKLFDKNRGLTIDDKGIIDNSTFTSGFLITWEDIMDVSLYQVKSTKLLLIHVSDNERYLEQMKGLKKMLGKQNIKLTGTPLSINPNSLDIKFDELNKLVSERLEYYNKTT
ncbi:STM3941 family protein [Flavobacterium psychrotrophum]|uniref:STM3941 family protein n=1 Tax=Flavobacterium psychrotrophum TaxID=2294119 RepID=UPI000E322DD0|nr:STM3941 family protein [Flavobacterium psychrotrophum]